VDIITPGYREGAAHVLDVVSLVASRNFNYAIYEFSALAATETQCATTDADDNDDGTAPDPLVLLVATLQCQMQDFESRMCCQEALRSQMVVEMWATAAEMRIALRSQMTVEMWAMAAEMQSGSTCLLDDVCLLLSDAFPAPSIKMPTCFSTNDSINIPYAPEPMIE